MNKDTIYRADAIEALEHLSACKEYGIEIGTDEETYIGKYEAITAISDLPSVDRPKGEWILDPNGMDWNLPAWRCSRCGAKNDNIGVVAKGIASDPYRWAGSKFCPQCGCEMRAKESE